jgi:hypothetical protein
MLRTVTVAVLGKPQAETSVKGDGARHVRRPQYYQIQFETNIHCPWRAFSRIRFPMLIRISTENPRAA